MATASSPLNRFLHRLLKAVPPRAQSLCVSLLGDALAPHGGAIWLGGLITLLEPLGINERQLRTSVFRLVAQGWLTAERHGRRSLYRLAEQGQRDTAHASPRVYEGTLPEWDGAWTLVALPRTGNNALAERAELRRELQWEGFGMIAPGLFAHPRIEPSAAHNILKRLGIPDKALILAARDMSSMGGLPIASLAAQCWNLDDVAGQYRIFARNFAPLAQLLEGKASIDPASAFAARVLLLHHWRRAVLHDPRLPAELLPEPRADHEARELCARLYWRLFDDSETYLDEVAGQDNPYYRALDADTLTRFGGRDGRG